MNAQEYIQECSTKRVIAQPLPTDIYHVRGDFSQTVWTNNNAATVHWIITYEYLRVLGMDFLMHIQFFFVYIGCKSAFIFYAFIFYCKFIP